MTIQIIREDLLREISKTNTVWSHCYTEPEKVKLRSKNCQGVDRKVRKLKTYWSKGTNFQG